MLTGSRLLVFGATLTFAAIGASFAQDEASNVIIQPMPVAGTPLNDTQLAAVEQRLAEERLADERVSQGPYFDDPVAMELLDGTDRGDCTASSLAFGCLIQGRAAVRERLVGKLKNPFHIGVAIPIRKTIEQDLREPWGPGTTWKINAQQMPERFLTDEHSRIELVGIVSRLDRKFVPDVREGRVKSEDCGEVSLIYRFGYDIGGGNKSRLPVTMNVVFPMLPDAKVRGVTSCATVAARWLEATSAGRNRTGQALVDVITDTSNGITPLLPANEIDRIELNIQVYRRAASDEDTNLGSTAEYVIRVFRWSERDKAFTPSYLFNQIDRALLTSGQPDANSCPKPDLTITKEALWDELLRPKQLGDIDNGTVIIPRRFLACRAVSMSPGGEHRSGNNPFWDPTESADPILPKERAARAIEDANQFFLRQRARRRLRMIASVEDLRARLNQQSCTGCHQTRAIAGFHFPGRDRQTDFGANAIALSGSPNFFGDQSRRMRILRAVATGKDVSMTTSYASRPLATEASALMGSQLVGGWGGICRIQSFWKGSQRQWGCQTGYSCRQQFVSTAAPGVGTCVPRDRFEIGDPTQVGNVTTEKFRQERYIRRSDMMKAYASSEGALVVLKPELFPQGAGNAYYAAQQEFHAGLSKEAISKIPEASRRNFLDFQRGTGGFPSGSLRLVECTGLPFEANCGLLATSGFTNCLGEVGTGKPLSDCFRRFTSFAGARACSASMPCRDDYICLKGLGWNTEQLNDGYDRRLRYRDARYAEEGVWGQVKPELSWAKRNGGQGDHRGVCVPPYFVAQFKSDGHPH